MLAARRAHFEHLKTTAARPLILLRIPALAVTLAAVPLVLLAILAWYLHYPGLSLTLALAAALMDFLDGAVARATSSRSPLGDYLDAIVDRVVELLLLLQLSSVCGLAASAALGASMLVSYCKPRLALVLPTDNQDWPGLGDHADRMVLILVAWALAPRLPGAASLVLWALAGLALVGSAQRVAYALRRIRESNLSAIRDQSE